MSAPHELDRAAIRAHLDQLTKPPGSLGRLEDLAERLCAVQGRLDPLTTPRKLVIFAGDHGVVASGVSAWPSDVTGLMIDNIRGGGAASSVLARANGTQLLLVDVGAQGPSRESGPGFRNARIADGTRDLSREPAMTAKEFDAAWAVGVEEARRAVEGGARVVATGEMGIGNTTPAACLAAYLLDCESDELVGPGAGADAATVARKRAIVAAAVERARTLPDRKDALASICGYEIAAMAGFLAEASARGTTCVLDGVIATAAALIAEDLVPGSRDRWIASHCSAEPAHAGMLERLELDAALDWGLRLGEGTGALLLMPMLDAAAAMTSGMATFAELGLD
jgi:nicotinate-nucleotide--dimethylbenzimidazole phosphoribosyltransferase